MKRFVLPVLLFASLSLCASAQEPGLRPFSVEAIDAIVQEEALARGVPGLGVAIVAHGQVLCCRGYGVADVRSGTFVTAATAFNIASVTKPFTALLLLDLVERGRIELDAKARTVLPWLPECFAEITVRHLLTHTSGIVRDVRLDNADDPDFIAYRDRIAKAGPSFAPGARFEYSNTGFAVLGFLAEAVEGMPLDALLRRQLFAPRRMDQACYRTPVTEPTRAQPHQVVGRSAVPVPYVTGGFGSGGLALSAADFAGFAVALQRGELLPAARLAAAFVPARLASGEEARCAGLTDDDRYGFGWFVSSLLGKRLLTHGGAIQGFSANLYHFPDEQITIAAVANCKARDDGQAPVDPLCRRLAAFCLENGRAATAADAEPALLRSVLAAASDRVSTAILAGKQQALRAANLQADADRLQHRFYGEGHTRHGDVVTERGTWFERRKGGEGDVCRAGHCLWVWRLVDETWTLAESVPLRAPASPVVAAADDRERKAVAAAVLDYLEGIYATDAERVARSVHSTLAKRGYWREAGKVDYASEPMTYEQLMETAKTYNKDRRPMGNAPREITVFDVLDQTASARLVAQWGIDYFHLARIDNRWQIVNVLWQSPPRGP